VSCFVRNGKRVTSAALLDKPAMAPACAAGRDGLSSAARLVADYTVFSLAMRRLFLATRVQLDFPWAGLRDREFVQQWPNL
jgi:hypothetical protein